MLLVLKHCVQNIVKRLQHVSVLGRGRTKYSGSLQNMLGSLPGRGSARFWWEEKPENNPMIRIFLAESSLGVRTESAWHL